MSSDSASHVPTQQSVKAYVDSQSSGAVSAVANGADNRIATFSSSTALNGESTLTYNGSTLTFDGSNDGNRNIELGANGSGTAFIDLIASDTYTDYSLRLIRWSGDNSTSDLVHRGTGDLRFITSDAANILWLTGGAEKMRMQHSTGNLGIGTNSPAEKLHVNGSIKADTSLLIGSNCNFLTTQLKVGDGTRDIRLNANHGGKAAVGTVGSHDFNFFTANTIRATVDSGGNFGIGGTTPQSKLMVVTSAESSIPSAGADSAFFTIGNVSSGTAQYGTMMGTLGSGKGYIQQQRFDGTATTYNLLLQPNGSKVGIGTQSPGYTLDVSGDIRATGDLRASDDIVLDVNNNFLYARDASNTLTRVLGINSSNNFYIGPIDNYAGGYMLYGTNTNVTAHYFTLELLIDYKQIQIV